MPAEEIADWMNEVEAFDHLYQNACATVKRQTVVAGNDTFCSLWDAVKTRPVIKRVIAEQHIRGIFIAKPVQRESASHLQQLFNLVVKNQRVLQLFELPLDRLREMMIVTKILLWLLTYTL
jgi:hypothetical protein